jgi:hypothetical protein
MNILQRGPVPCQGHSIEKRKKNSTRPDGVRICVTGRLGRRQTGALRAQRARRYIPVCGYEKTGNRTDWSYKKCDWEARIGKQGRSCRASWPKSTRLQSLGKLVGLGEIRRRQPFVPIFRLPHFVDVFSSLRGFLKAVVRACQVEVDAEQHR